MKTAQLIEQLKKEDPEGDTEVVVGGTPIHFVSREPGYYDGHYEVLIEDPAKKPYYAVIGGVATGQGSKVKLHLLSIEDALYNCNTEEELDAFILTLDFQNYVLDESRERREKPYRDMVKEVRLFIRMFKALDDYGKDSKQAQDAERLYDEFSEGENGINNRDPWDRPRKQKKMLRDAVLLLRELLKEEGPDRAHINSKSEPTWNKVCAFLDRSEGIL